MSEVLEKIVSFNDVVLRNTVAIDSTFNAFDDLSDDLDDWADADRAVDFTHELSLSEWQYNAIDYVFLQHEWRRSRFGNGSFPVWYASMDLLTTFHETVFHWRQLLTDAKPLLDLQKNEPIYHKRTVFSVQCQSTLVDFREKVNQFPFLISKNDYQNTQRLGGQLYREGMPGLLSQSARYDEGTNIALFKKNALKNPTHQGDYLYQLSPGNVNVVDILDGSGGKLLETIK